MKSGCCNTFSIALRGLNCMSVTSGTKSTGNASKNRTPKEPVKSPSDKCARCDHPRKDHNPPKTYSGATNMTRDMTAHQIVVVATTCCYSNPLCSCVKFIEPGGNPKGTYQVDGYWF